MFGRRKERRGGRREGGRKKGAGEKKKRRQGWREGVSKVFRERRRRREDSLERFEKFLKAASFSLSPSPLSRKVSSSFFSFGCFALLSSPKGGKCLHEWERKEEGIERKQDAASNRNL